MKRNTLILTCLIFTFGGFIFQLMKIEQLEQSSIPVGEPNFIESAHKYELIESNLLSVNHRYYIYDSSIIDPPEEKNYTYCAAAAFSIWKALESHPELRTFDPNDATFFIPPVYVNLFDTSKRSRAKFTAKLDALTSSEIYNATKGVRHILLALDGYYYLYHAAYNQAKDIKYYRPSWWNGEGLPSSTIFENIILARDRDVWALRKMHLDENNYHEWNELISRQGPIPLHGFSIGFRSAPGDLEFVTPTYDKFVASKYVYFYHTRTEQSVYNSTVYRKAPINNLPVHGTAEYNTYNHSSIGYDIDKEKWANNFRHSKFCLVVRGDDPLSSALLKSIRVGCIPVVASDLYPVWGQPFKSILNMSDYVIMIDEQEFVNNPWHVLHRVYSELTEKQIRQKLQALEFAQRVVFPDHPDSLFVPAFLKEAWRSIPDSQRGVGCKSDSSQAPEGRMFENLTSLSIDQVS